MVRTLSSFLVCAPDLFRCIHRSAPVVFSTLLSSRCCVLFWRLCRVKCRPLWFYFCPPVLCVRLFCAHAWIVLAPLFLLSFFFFSFFLTSDIVFRAMDACVHVCDIVFRAMDVMCNSADAMKALIRYRTGFSKRSQSGFGKGGEYFSVTYRLSFLSHRAPGNLADSCGLC